MTGPSGTPGDPLSIPSLIAKAIVAGATGLKAADLAPALGEVTIRTQILGASFLTITVIDPQWSLITSGLLKVDVDGLIEQIEVEFPAGSGSFWRLCAIDGTTDLTAANLTLTLEDRIVAELRDEWGPKLVASGVSTRAQFIKSLVGEVTANGGIKFVCPSLNVVQQVASSTANALGTAIVSTAINQQKQSAKANKTKGVGSGAAITIKNVGPPSPVQIQTINTLLGVGEALGAPTVALIACMFAGTWESSLTPNVTNTTASISAGGGSYVGPLSGNSTVFPTGDPTAEANAFFSGGKGFQNGGAIALAKSGNTNPIEIAALVESGLPGNPYSGEAGYISDAHAIAEATAIVNAFGGGAVTTVPGLTATQVAAAGGRGVSDITQLQRGTPQNPDENSWDCTQRLASDVAWYAFSNADTLYYMDGPDLVAQTPSLYVKRRPDNSWQATNTMTNSVTTDIVSRLSFTYDNTSLVYQASHKHKGKVARRSRTAKPQTPSQILLSLVCGIDDYRAGEVVVFQDAGPINGRWVITDATRNCLADTFTQFTLEPPTQPYPEPQASSTGSTGQAPGLGPGNTAPGTGTGIASQVGAVTSGQVSPQGYINPFSQIKNLTPLRIDMGVDYSGSGPILAMGDGHVYCTSGVGNPGWPGGTFIGITLTSGVYAGKSIYHAENITPTVTVNQMVKRGDVIGTMIDAPPNTESGWGTGVPEEALATTLGQSGGTNDGCATGSSFNRLLVATGCPSGILAPGTAHGTMPAGYP